jgi:hypothetical protein
MSPAIKGSSGRESPSLYEKNAQGLGTLRLPTPKRDMESYSGISRADEASGFRTDSFYDRIGAGPLYKRKQLDTPNSELNNYLNWVPNKEKLNINALQKNMLNGTKQTSTLTPFRPQREDDERSKTVLKVRDRFTHRSLIDEIKATMAIDGYSINGDKVKPRALSKLKTYNNNGSMSSSLSKIELNSLLGKKSNGGTKTPMTKRSVLNELPWED